MQSTCLRITKSTEGARIRQILNGSHEKSWYSSSCIFTFDLWDIRAAQSCFKTVFQISTDGWRWQPIWRSCDDDVMRDLFDWTRLRRDRGEWHGHFVEIVVVVNHSDQQPLIVTLMMMKVLTYIKKLDLGVGASREHPHKSTAKSSWNPAADRWWPHWWRWPQWWWQHRNQDQIDDHDEGDDKDGNDDKAKS